MLHGSAASPARYFHRYCVGEAIGNNHLPTRGTEAGEHTRQAVKQTEKQRDTDSRTDWVGPRVFVEAWENIKSPELKENRLKIPRFPAHSLVSARSQR
jgi:hypothetical protein